MTVDNRVNRSLHGCRWMSSLRWLYDGSGVCIAVWADYLFTECTPPPRFARSYDFAVTGLCWQNIFCFNLV